MLESRSLASVYGVGDETLECEIILTISTPFFSILLLPIYEIFQMSADKPNESQTYNTYVRMMSI